jgi:hypothetical protein
VIVDLGGCYFQGIISAVLLFVSYSTGWEPLRLAVILSLYSALFSLNPIFKFDGYWVLADCLGVPNLSRQPGRIGKYLFSRIRRHPVEPLPWPSWVIHVLMAYSGIVIAVWTFFAFRLLPMLILELRLIRHTGAAMVRQLMAGRLPAWQDVATALYASALLLLITVTLWNIVRQPVRSVFLWVRRVIQRIVKGHTVETIHGSMPRLPGQLENFVSPAGQRHSPASNNTGGRSKTEAAR